MARPRPLCLGRRYHVITLAVCSREKKGSSSAAGEETSCFGVVVVFRSLSAVVVSLSRRWSLVVRGDITCRQTGYEPKPLLARLGGSVSF